jgi:hypothetical protein
VCVPTRMSLRRTSDHAVRHASTKVLGADFSSVSLLSPDVSLVMIGAPQSSTSSSDKEGSGIWGMCDLGNNDWWMGCCVYGLCPCIGIPFLSRDIYQASTTAERKHIETLSFMKACGIELVSTCFTSNVLAVFWHAGWLQPAAEKAAGYKQQDMLSSVCAWCCCAPCQTGKLYVTVKDLLDKDGGAPSSQVMSSDSV